jgi:hypothetical protein
MLSKTGASGSGSLALAVEEFERRFVLQYFVHAFVGQAAPKNVQRFAGLSQESIEGRVSIKAMI